MNKVALVTGGSGDIGTAIVKALHAECEHVFALDSLPEDVGLAWEKTLHHEGFNNIHFRKMDVSNYIECERICADIVEAVGSIDVLINNAGITRDAVFTKMTKHQWDEVLTVNLDGMFNVTKQVVEPMRANGYGRIINISSVNAQKGQFSQANYAASKAGVYGFTKSLAQELISKQITVNSISPGYVNTKLMTGIRADILSSIIEQIPAKRLAEPNEIAHVVTFLTHENSRYITGTTISINGGLYMA